MNQIGPPDLLEIATEATLQAGKLLRERWLEPRELSHKGFRDWVTDADFASQALLTDIIRRTYPTHGFLTEEEAPHLPRHGDLIWIIDPVDGTSNYSRQQPNFCISLAAAKSDEIQAAVIYDPIRDELFTAAIGRGSELNGTPLIVSDVMDPAEAILALDWSHNPAQRQETVDFLERAVHQVHTVRAIGSAALALAWVAAGRLDAYVNLSIKPWDFAAGELLIHLAGGRCNNLIGQPLRPSHGNSKCLASNSHLHQFFQNLLHADDAEVA